jgi:hypothetical protein
MAATLEYLSRPQTPASTSYFFNLLEDIGRALEPTPTQLTTLERSYQSTGEFLTLCPEFEGHLLEIHPQGSRELGTMTRPVNKADGFDIDLVARLDQRAWHTYSGTSGPKLLLDRLHTAVGRYAKQHNLKLIRWDRCVTLEYADGMSADIAPVIDWPVQAALHGDLHGLIPDRDMSRYHPSNPRGFTKLFGKIAALSPVFLTTEMLKAEGSVTKRADVVPLAPADEVFGRLLCRLVQVMKLHRNVSFAKSDQFKHLMPSSVFLTVLAAQSYQVQAPRPHIDQLDLLTDIIRTMPTMFRRDKLGNGREEWYLANPTAPGDNLAATMNEPGKHEAFFQWHAQLTKDVTGLIASIDGRLGMDRVHQIVTEAFGDKAASATREAQLGRQSSSRMTGRAVATTAAGIVIPMTAKSHTFFGG